MITIDNVQYRNLEEQVKKNMDDIQYILEEEGVLNEFGIKIVGQITSSSQLPDPDTYQGEYGDAYAVGTSAPYTLYIYTRANGSHPNDYWFNIGQFPTPGNIPGPAGPAGPKGDPGARGSTWTNGTSNPTSTSGYIANDKYLNTTTGQVFNFNGTSWQEVGSIRGPQGIQGQQGPVGPQGQQGIQGPKGDTGPAGPAFVIGGKVANEGQLPAPSTLADNIAYLVGNDTDGYDLYVQLQDTQTWQNVGKVEVVEGLPGDPGPQGPQGPQGIQGKPGAVYTPDLSANGDISWSNNGGLPNPPTVNIKGPKGDPGQSTIVKTAAEWASDNTVLEAGQFGYDSTNKITKIGDGITAWANLPLFITSEIDMDFATLSWHTINQLSQEGFADKYFSVGDEKTINLTTGEQVTLVILGFNHDDLTSGGKAGISIGMKNLLATKYRMNASNTNVGGWDESEMRTSTMATLLSQLPSDLQSVIKQVNKKATAGGNSMSITTSADKLWLFAEVEIDGATWTGYADEGEQYEYWKTVKDGTVTADRIKYSSNGSGSADFWWLRSPSVSDSAGFRGVDTTGNINSYSANYARGVSFGFCV